ncbi:MAG: hypothetical protein GWP91_24525, partial [Rhodobacterales bacterium]|nr:hypothetical protein [Rhodobacterales bacterium]
MLTVSWSTDEPGVSWVEYGLDGPKLSTPKTASGTQHELVVLGLKANQATNVQAFTQTEEGLITSEVRTVTPGDVPDWFSEVDLTTYDTETSQMGDGYLLMSISKALGGFEGVGSAVVVMDGDGDYVWWHEVDAGKGSMSATFHNGSLMWDEYDAAVLGDLATFVTLDLAATQPLVRQRIPQGHHMATPISSDEIAWIARDIHNIEGPNGAILDIQTDRIREASIDQTETPDEVFSLFAAYDGMFHYPCTHTLISQARYGYENLFEWTHSNSLVYLPDQSAYFMNSRWTDTVWKVDRSSGALLWQMGGPNSDFTGPDGESLWDGVQASSLWSHGHFSHLWDGGLVMFDNGNHHSPPASGIVEVAFDENTMVAEEVFRYTDPEGRSMNAVGDVRKLSGGNYLISWSTWGVVNEVTPAGEV